MKANDIQKLVKNTSPYETIMIDGDWGVGKSYEIKKALIDNTNSCILSLFGINSCKEMFSSLFLRLGLNSKISEFYALWILNSEELKGYVEEIFKSLDKITFEKYISSIKVFVSNGDYRKAYMKIKDISDREWQGIEESKIIELLNSDILPLGSISEEQWRMFKALKDLFMKTDYRKQLWVNYIKIAEEENKYDKA